MINLDDANFGVPNQPIFITVIGNLITVEVGIRCRWGAYFDGSRMWPRFHQLDARGRGARYCGRDFPRAPILYQRNAAHNYQTAARR